MERFNLLSNCKFIDAYPDLVKKLKYITNRNPPKTQVKYLIYNNSNVLKFRLYVDGYYPSYYFTTYKYKNNVLRVINRLNCDDKHPSVEHYDINGDLVCREWLNKDGLYHSISFQCYYLPAIVYYKNNKVIREEWYSEGSRYRNNIDLPVIINYDLEGRIIAKVWNDNKDHYRPTIIKYDSYGFIIYKQHYDNIVLDGSVTEDYFNDVCSEFLLSQISDEVESDLESDISDIDDELSE